MNVYYLVVRVVGLYSLLYKILYIIKKTVNQFGTTDMKQYVYLMLGYPGSGKSFFARQLAEQIGAVRFNSDQMRHHLFDSPQEHHTRDDHKLITGAINYAASAVLCAGYSAIYDFNNNFVKDRMLTADLVKRLGACVIVVWIKTPLALATERGTTRTLSREHIRVTSDWIQRVAAEIEVPISDELCIEIDGRVDFSRQYDQFSEQLRCFGLL